MTADKNDMIGHIHKNHLSNLVVLCETCHNKAHRNELTIKGYQQTSEGAELVYKDKSDKELDPCNTFNNNDVKNHVVYLKQYEKKTNKYISESLKISMYQVQKILRNAARCTK